MEAETKHTPGKLKIGYGGQEGDGYYVINSPFRGRAIAEGTESDSIPDDEMRANAHRLVACWNALDGLSTEVIEQGTMEQDNQWARSNAVMAEATLELTRLQELNAELLEACKCLLAAEDDDASLHTDIMPHGSGVPVKLEITIDTWEKIKFAFAAARAAIAKAEKGKV